MTLEACFYLKNLSDERNIANAPTSRGTPFADSDGTMWQETILLARRSVENSNAPKKATGESGPQYFWLCSSCCRAMTVQSDGDRGVTIVPMRRAPQDVSIIDHRMEMVA